MNYKEIILNLLEAIDGLLIYKNPNFDDWRYGEFGNGRFWPAAFEKEYYRIFPESPDYAFLKDKPRGELLPIFDKLEEEGVLRLIHMAEHNQEYFDLMNEQIIETEGELCKMSQDHIDDLISFHFIKLENFDIYLKKIRNKARKEGSISDSLIIKNKSNKDITPLEVPEKTKWENITIRFIDGENVEITVGKQKYKKNYKDMGFQNDRKLKPNIQWALLKILSDRKGEINWSSSESSIKVKKTKQLLSDALKFYFQIDESPFYNYRKEKAYKVKFNLISE